MRDELSQRKMAQEKRAHLKTGQLYGCVRQTIRQNHRSDNRTPHLSCEGISRILLLRLEPHKREPKDAQHVREQADGRTDSAGQAAYGADDSGERLAAAENPRPLRNTVLNTMGPVGGDLSTSNQFFVRGGKEGYGGKSSI